jgi:hypothetical protein
LLYIKDFISFETQLNQVHFIHYLGYMLWFFPPVIQVIIDFNIVDLKWKLWYFFFISWQIILLIIYVMNYSSVFYGLSWLCDLTELDLCLPIFCTSFYFVLIYIGCCNSLRFHTFCLKKNYICVLRWWYTIHFFLYFIFFIQI